jgi:hypothetical protein
MKTEVQVKKKGRKPSNAEAFSKINAVKKGGSLIITRGEWRIKTVPGQHIIRRHTGREFKVETLADDSGWKVTALN